MRQIGAFSKEVEAAKFVQRLRKDHITALVEEDNGSFVIWVHDEGHIKQAKKIYQKMEKDGFKDLANEEIVNKPNPMAQSNIPPPPGPKNTAQRPFYQPYITKLLIFLCAFVYLYGVVQEYKEKEKLSGMLGISRLATYLLIDYPKSTIITKELVEKYGLENVKNNTLPESSIPLIKEFNAYTPWVGIYNIVLSPKQGQDRLWKGERFSDIKKGQVWRLFSPAILHRDLLHFLFNVLWLAILGRMVEMNMGRVKFSLFVLSVALVTNVCQYFITGPFFMGISGVVCAFIGYIWVRKKRAPWEIYDLQKQMMTFFLIYIFGLLAIQGIIFLLSYFQIYTVPLRIANTAHVVGFLIGAFFGRIGLLAKRV
ncbi:MAG: Rhomboid protease GlpG [Chlamydiia bacterium]|nr:Rhomboid protease GlpG [Chlamydiia bacterium]MCH9618514.1 Rhomboid protease GlpG [Chlamydiia bacterium]MCH9623803.1 Rhomboid protease GlpG [Chlamydiia bacterium]